MRLNRALRWSSNNLSYSITNGVGTVVGAANAAAKNAIIYVYSDSSKALDKRFNSKADGKDYTIASATDGSFTFSFDAATDTVFVTQLTFAATGRNFEGPATQVTKKDTSIVTPIKDIRTNDNTGKSDKIGQTFTVEGIVLADFEIAGAKTFYIQDATAGIAIYGALPAGVTVAPGDLVRVTGAIAFYNGLTELAPTAVEKLGTGNPLPTPKDTTIADMNTFATAEPLEGTLVKLTGKVTVIPSSPDTSAGYNVTIVDANNKALTLRVTVASKIDVAKDIQVGLTYTFTGIASQYKSTSPYTSGYQVFPRSVADVSEIKELSLTHSPLTQAYKETNLTFTATARNAESVKVYYRLAGGGAYTPLAMTSADNLQYTAVLAAASAPASNFEYYIEAISGSEIKQSGTPAKPWPVSVVEDTTAPRFYGETPLGGTKVESQRPNVYVKYEEPSGLDANTLLLSLMMPLLRQRSQQIKLMCL